MKELYTQKIRSVAIQSTARLFTCNSSCEYDDANNYIPVDPIPAIFEVENHVHLYRFALKGR